MKEFSVVMSLVDFVPVILYTIAAIILQRDLYYKMSKGAFALLSAGTIDIVSAGSAKALYKLLYAAGVCDFDKLNQMFFPVQSLGFLLAGIAVIAMFTHKQQNKVTVLSAAPALYTGTFLFVGFMVAGLACVNGGLAVVAAKMKKPGIVVLLVISFICSMCMGYLSSQNFDKAFMNWVCEFINTLGQGTFLWAAILLHKNNLAEFRLKKDETKIA